MPEVLSEPTRPNPPRWREGVAVVWIVGYLLFFFQFTLPNSNPPVSRVDLVLSLPELLWSNIDAPPQAPPASWKNLGQRADLIVVMLAIWLANWAVGRLILRALRMPLRCRSLEWFVISCGVGASAVSLLTLAFGLAGWMSRGLIGSLLALFVVTEFACSWREWSTRTVPAENMTSMESAQAVWHVLKGFATRGEQLPFPWIAKSVAAVAIALFVLAMWLGSLLPPTDFDVKAYHLTGPKEYFLNGQITFLPHNVYTNFPFLTEMLCLLGMILRQDWYWGAVAGQGVLMGFAPLTGLALFCAGRRWFGPTVGWWGAAIYLSTPWTYRLAIIAYVEGALSCYLFLALFATLLALESLRRGEDRSQSNRLFLLAGLFAGSAMACKYPGLVSVVIPLGAACVVTAFRLPPSAVSQARTLMASPSPLPRRLKSVLLSGLAFGAGTALTVGPWLLKNLWMTGNPVYPLAYGVFGGRDWDAAAHAKWRAGHSPNTFALSDLIEKFIDVTAKADWLSPLLFGLAPLAVFSACRRRAASPSTAPCPLPTAHLTRWLWWYVAFLFAQWWLLTHRIDRFWVPMIPVVAWLAAIGATWSSGKLWRWACGSVTTFAVLFNLGFITTPLCGFNAYLSDLQKAREAAEGTAEGIHYLNQLMAAGRLPPDATVLCVGEAQVFDARPRVLYNTVFDQPLFQDWLAEPASDGDGHRDWRLRPITEIRANFRQAGVTHVLVNWQELLRYRQTYGYSDFVTPQRFEWLQEQGLLGDPGAFSTGWRSFDSLRPEDQREVLDWAPSLKRVVEDKSVFLTWQLFPVRP
jgi:hypothetical protein